jgi:hypothetical protein
MSVTSPIKSEKVNNTMVTKKSSSSSINYETISDTAKRIASQISFQGIVHYAICGLGDSKYTTYMNNPTVIDTTLRDYLQATPLCPLGYADASSSSLSTTTSNNSTEKPKEQADIIAEWVEQLWLPLSTAIYNNNDSKTTDDRNHDPTKNALQQLEQQLIQLCQEIIPDYHPPHVMTNQKNNKNNSIWIMNPISMFSITIVVVLIAIIVAQYRN